MASSFAADGTIYDTGLLQAKDSDGIRNYLDQSFSTNHIDSLASTIDTITINGNVAVVLGTYDEKTTDTTSQSNEAKLQYVAEWIYQSNGQWLLNRFSTVMLQRYLTGKSMNIFVTGGAGYIGSATAQALLDAGHSVTVYDSLITGHRAAVPEKAHFIHASLDDSHALAEALISGEFDAVMHFAAFIEAGESMKDPGRFFHNNFANSLSLIESATRAGIKKFVFSSTAAVYVSSDQPLTEDSPLGPTNVYGQTKLMTEQTLEWYRQIHGLHFACVALLQRLRRIAGTRRSAST